MNPALQTKGSDVSKFKAKGDNWKTASGRQLTGTQLKDNWGVKLLGAENWVVRGLSGRQLGKN